jgi:hypothetical protein
MKRNQKDLFSIGLKSTQPAHDKHAFTSVGSVKFWTFCSPFLDGGTVVLSACDFGRLLPATWNRGERFVCRDLNGHSDHRFAAVVGLGPGMQIPFNPGRLGRPAGRPRRPFRPHLPNRRQAARRWSGVMGWCWPSRVRR